MQPGEQQGSRRWLAFLGWAAFAIVAVVASIVTFLRASETPLHTNPADLPSVTQADPAPAWAAAVDRAREMARSGVVNSNVPGLSVAVGVGGELVWAEGFGWADLEKKVPLAPHMRFRIGHASKTLTSAAVGLLLEEGQLGLDDEIQAYVPTFPRKPWTITLRQLMANVSGIRHYRNDADFMPSTHCGRASEGLEPFAEDPLRFQPESEYGYSTFGWVLVSAAVESVANEPFFDFMRRRIFEPLGMRSTTTDSVSESMPDLVTFYRPRLSGDITYGPEFAPDVDYSCLAGAGGFLSTPSDMVRFGLALTGGSLLKPETVSLLQSPQPLLSGEETEYGLGWMLDTHALNGVPTRAPNHSSVTLVGSSTSFMLFPERGIVVAVMSNTSRATLWPIAVDIAQPFAECAPGPERK